MVKDDAGNIVELHCTYDPATRGGNSPDGRKVKSTIHWVSAAHAVDAEVRLYETLFAKENPNDVEEGQDFTANLNPHSLEVLTMQTGAQRASAPRPGPAISSSGWGISAVDKESTAGTACLQSHGRTCAIAGQKSNNADNSR